MLSRLPAVLGQTRKRYGRWRFLGNTKSVFLLSTCAPSPRTRPNTLPILSLVILTLSRVSLFSILIGFIPCPAHPSTRLTAYLASKDDIKAYQPPPPFPLPQLDLDVQMGGDGDIFRPLRGGA